MPDTTPTQGHAKCRHGCSYIRPTQAEADRLADSCATLGGCDAGDDAL
jgi:hypothetical protein